MKQYHRPSTATGGFTLIELGVVLVIIGLLMGFGASLVMPLSQRAKRIESQKIVTAAVESIIGYAAANGRLPVWGDNVIDTVIDEFCEVVTARKDANGRPLYYFYSTQLNGAQRICNRKTADLNICLNADCTDRIMNVAFMVVSGSVNINPQTGIVTTGCPSGTCIGITDIGTADFDNCTNRTDCPDTNYDNRFDRFNRPEEFDDIVKWVTLNELKTKIACEGPPLKILNKEIPAASRSALPYTVTFYADGGIPFSAGYNWGISLPAGLTVTSPAKVSAANPWNAQENSLPTWNRSLSLTLTISAIPAVGSYPIDVTVRDANDATDMSGADTPCNCLSNEDNCARKRFVLTVNP